MSGNKGLVEEVIAELFQRLKQQPLMDAKTLDVLSSLAGQRKLTDTSALQAALQTPPGIQNENH
jgi:hypothetical protein